MYRDVVYYSNSSDYLVTFNGNRDLQCNVREIRPFAYSASGGSVTAGEKTFSMTITAREEFTPGSYHVNRWIDVLLADVHTSSYGRLTVNDWTLKCKCIGISAVETEYNGVAKFVATFYAPKLEWYKANSWSPVRGRGQEYFTFIQMFTSFAVDFDLDTRRSGKNLDYVITDYYLNPIQEIVGNFSELSPNTYTTNYINKTITAPGVTEPIKYLTDTSDCFRIYPPGNYCAYLIEGFTGYRIRTIGIRGTPEWQT